MGFDFCINHFLFHLHIYKIYQNMGMSKGINEMSIPTPYSHMSKHPQRVSLKVNRCLTNQLNNFI